jgi:hypothetical protein
LDFRYAAFGDNFMWVLARTATIDSYDARRGPYDGVNGTNTNHFFNGDIGTNGTDTAAPEFRIDWSSVRVEGTGYITPGTGVSLPSPWPRGANFQGPVTQYPVALPPIALPDPASYPMVFGDEVYLGVERCRERRYYRALQVDGEGQFIMEEGCQLFIEWNSGSPVARLNSLNTDGAGRLIVDANVKTPVTIFVKNGGFDLDGPGVRNDTRIPEKFQLYVKGESGRLRQTDPFHGVIYVEDTDGNTGPDGQLDLGRASEMGVSFDSTYHGAFIAGDRLWVQDYDESFTVTVHYDESLRLLPINGSGRAANTQVVFWGAE